MTDTPNAVELRTTIPEEIDRAITEVVRATGVSKATVVREALALHLAAVGLVHTSVAEALFPTTPTSGRGISALRKGQVMTIELPPYPGNGKATATQLRNAATRYRAKAQELRDALTSAEAEFGEGFARLDSNKSARDRIAAMAKERRTTARREGGQR